MHDTTYFYKLANEIAEKTQNSLLRQLDFMVNRGLLIVEQKEMLLTQDPHSNELNVNYSVELKLKDQEYILDLEKQIEVLNQTIKNFRQEK